MIIEQNKVGGSQTLLKLIAIEFKECLLDSPSFRASIIHKVAIVKENFVKLDKNNFSITNLDSWIYSDFVDNQIIFLYHNYIRPRLAVCAAAKSKIFTLIDDNSIEVINNLLISFKNYIGDFYQYQEKLNSLIESYCVTDYNNKPELMKQDSFNLYTFKIKDLNNSLNLIHELKNIRIKLNIELHVVLIKIIQKMNDQNSAYTTGEWIYSDTIKKLQKSMSNESVIFASQQKLNKDINVNKNLIIKAFKNEYDPIAAFNNYKLDNICETIENCPNPDKNLLEYKTWVFMALKDKNGCERYFPRFIYIKKNLFGLFQVSNDGRFVTESDKFGLELVNMKLIDHNNQENNFRKYSFILEFKDPLKVESDEEQSGENIAFSIKFQCVSFISLLKLYTVFKNVKDIISKGKLTLEERQLTRGRFAPLFKEFMIQDTCCLVNPNNKDSISLMKKMKQYTSANISTEVGLYCLNNINLPVITSATKLAIFANVYTTLGEDYIPNAITANTWGSEYWPILYEYQTKDQYKVKVPLLSQLFIKTQFDTDLTFQNVPFKTVFGNMSNEKAVLALNCFTYFTNDRTNKGSDMMFKTSLYATYKTLYIYLNTYGLISLLSIPLDDIVDMKLIHSTDHDDLEEPLTMIIYDKKQLNIAIKINYAQYYDMKAEYTPIDKHNVSFMSIISLFSIKEKIMYLIENLHQTNNSSRGRKSFDENNINPIFNVKRSQKEDDKLKMIFYQIDYKYCVLNKKYNKLILFQNSNPNKNQIVNTDLPLNKIQDLLLASTGMGTKTDLVSNVSVDSNINIIEFKTSLSIKNDWSKLHKLEVPIKIDALALLLLGRKNIFFRRWFRDISEQDSSMINLGRDASHTENNFGDYCKPNNDEKQDQQDNGDESWYESNKLVFRHYKAVLREKKVFNSFVFDNTGTSIGQFNTNEIVVVETLLQYIPQENLIVKMEFGKFDIPILGSVMANLYWIVERNPSSSNKSIISFYFDLYPLKDIGNKLLPKLIFKILKNYLYKRHLNAMTFFKHTLSKVYKSLGNKGQYIQCLKLSGSINILKTNKKDPLSELEIKPISLNRVTLASLIIQYYLLRIIILLFSCIKKIYLITGVLITNITLINKTVVFLLMGSTFLNFLLLTNDYGKSFMMKNKIETFNKSLMNRNDRALLERSLTLKEVDELIDKYSLNENILTGKLWFNFEKFKVKDSDYRTKKSQMGIERNKLLVELASLHNVEITQFNNEFEKFINSELDKCMTFEIISKENTNLSVAASTDLLDYCQHVKNLYIGNQFNISSIENLL